MKTPHRCLVFFVLLWGSAALSSAQNLLSNGTFDSGISPWEASTDEEEVTVAAFSDLDADAASGSIRVTTTSRRHSGSGVLSECIPVVAGTIYQHRYDYLIEPVNGDATVSASVSFYYDSACSIDNIPSIGPGVGDGATAVADGAWHAGSHSFDLHRAPEGALSARLSLKIVKPFSEGPVTAHFDNVALKFLDELWLQGHFRVTGSWSTPEASGSAHVGWLPNGSGYLWFFDPSNIEVVIKVIDACESFGRYWMFAGGLTNVEVDIVVTDMRTGQTKTYHNDWNVPFAPLQDMYVCDLSLRGEG